MESHDPQKRTVLFVEMPSSPTKKNLAAAILAELKDPFAEARGHSAEVKFARVVLLLKNLGVEMLVLDEAQHLVDYRRNGAYEAADWIKSLMNETVIPLKKYASEVEFSPDRIKEILREDIAFFRQPNHRHPQASRGWNPSARAVP
ncbi:TniB family NTP-binding protein [Pseudomonas qingdaonensis]|nr:TniB family NTP-binding protein [Pseudomonas qingdaonensis]